ERRNLAGMIRSVSMLSPRRGSARPPTWRIRSIATDELPDINHLAGHGRRGDHRGAHQQCPSRWASLTALEVPVGRRRADLAAFELVGIHREAHRAACATPIEP